MSEVWKNIEGYGNVYQVSDMGRVRSMRRMAARILVQNKGQDGYFKVGLYDENRKQHTVFVHRLVAEAFIENPDGKNTVDHINMDKSDNRACNLRWATSAEQNEFKKGRRGENSIYTKMKIKNMETGEVFENSAMAAHWVLENNLTNSQTIGYIAERIRFAAKGSIYGRKSAFGHNWRFLEG